MSDHHDFIEGYRITREASSVIIETIDYHARPLRLSVDDLAKLGLQLTDGQGSVRNRLTRRRMESDQEA